MASSSSSTCIRKFETEEATADAVAKYVSDLSAKSIADHGLFSVVLSGGTLFDTLSKVPIPETNIYPIKEGLSPEEAADEYEQRLKNLVANKTLKTSTVTGFAKFDLMLVGMGPDGHVASLFCWHFQRFEKTRWVTFITDSPKPPPPRITFTFPLINSASEIALVIVGEEKADAVKVALGEHADYGYPLPVQKVKPEGGLTWFLDNGATSLLKKIVEPPYLGSVPIPESNIYPIKEGLSPEEAADEYEQRLKNLVANKTLKTSPVTGFAKFDLMLVGMGPDGHVASLFCWHFQRFEKKRWVTFITDSPKPPPPRITFTFHLINSASEIALVIVGEEKVDAVKVALGEHADYGYPLPVQKVKPEGGLTWFLDNGATSLLK
nr:probable 6-phosphogluconolactonase 4, chloroplastic [Tanacetum cinerariifolium]